MLDQKLFPPRTADHAPRPAPNTRGKYLVHVLAEITGQLYDMANGRANAKQADLESITKTLTAIAAQLQRMGCRTNAGPTLDDLIDAVDSAPNSGEGGPRVGDYAPRPEPTRPTGGGAAALAELL